MITNQTASAATTQTDKPAARARIDPRIEPERWIMNNQRITNERDLDGWLALYTADATIDYITNGAHDRFEGMAAIETSARAMATV
ncbi:MAG: hypothetical protein JWN48_2157, partial [Myxococcaceae bacterium]|nr:hypothetical protein [Myxococcaceae bacterium]